MQTFIMWEMFVELVFIMFRLIQSSVLQNKTKIYEHRATANVQYEVKQFSRD